MSGQSLTIWDCNIIANKCRKQIAHARGMIEALRLLDAGEDIDDIHNKAEEIIQKYDARLKEIIAEKKLLKGVDNGY